MTLLGEMTETEAKDHALKPASVYLAWFNDQGLLEQVEKNYLGERLFLKTYRYEAGRLAEVNLAPLAPPPEPGSVTSESRAFYRQISEMKLTTLTLKDAAARLTGSGYTCGDAAKETECKRVTTDPICTMTRHVTLANGAPRLLVTPEFLVSCK